MNGKVDYMKKRLIYLTGAIGFMAIAVAVIIFVCSANSEEIVKYPCDYVSEIEFLKVESRVLYYNVYLTADTKWKDNEVLQEVIAKYAITQCHNEASLKKLVKFVAIGYENNGNVAFSWDGRVISLHQILYYEDGVYSHNYYMKTSELQRLGYTVIDCT